MPIDPEMAAYLDAIDATLAGEPVDPRHAEIAELALLLADERPRPRPEFAAALDARAARRFAPASPAGQAAPQPIRRRWGRGLMAGGLASACAAAMVAIVHVLGNGPGGSSSSSTRVGAPAPKAAVSSAASSAPAAHAPAPRDQAATPSGAASGGQALALPPNGRKVVQSAQLELSTAPKNIDSVAQEVFNVVGDANGIVDHSQITQTGGPDGNANFQLRLPSATLSQTLARLSSLRGAMVTARTDSSQDVNSQYVSANRQLADDTALRNSLLKQLGAATTTQQIDSIKAQLKNAEASIAADQAALRQLNAQINYSRVTVDIYAGATPTPVPHHSSGGFTLGHAAHVAGRVLVVAAGVGLIALAALLPVALVATVLAWGASLLRRRRREQALDLA
jgi:predicted RNA-binding protein YlxR (DUF448 family)